MVGRVQDIYEVIGSIPVLKRNQIKFSSLNVSTVLFLLTVNKDYFLGGGLVINLLNLVLLKTLSDMLISFLHK